MSGERVGAKQSMEVQGELDPELVFQSKRLIEIVDYWRPIRGDRAMPSRHDVDPLKIPGHLLPHLELIDVLPPPEQRFRWRLIGTHVTEAVVRATKSALTSNASTWPPGPTRRANSQAHRAAHHMVP